MKIHTPIQRDVNISKVAVIYLRERKKFKKKSKIVDAH
jgi:hypothetical protein